jgi:outer membrane immunogenic protein
MKKYASLVAVIAAAAATPAFAQDAHGIEAYAGAIGGWDHVRVSVGVGSKDGFVYGGVIGAQTHVGGAAVVGLEGEIDGATTKETEHDVLVAGDTASIKAGRDFFIGARAGFVVDENTLLYVKGGYTNARFSASYDDGAGTHLSDGQNFDGYRLGAGVEYSLGHLKFRGEYRFSDYGHLNIAGIDTGVSGQRHQIVFGALYGF